MGYSPWGHKVFHERSDFARTYAQLETINGFESIIFYEDLKTLTTDNKLVQRKHNSIKEEKLSELGRGELGPYRRGFS